MKNLQLKTAFIAVPSFLLLAASAHAATTDPLFTAGVTGSYSQYRLTGKGLDGDDKAEFGKGGVFANFGNKLTGEAGFIYQFELKGQYGEKKNDEVRDGQADLDLGFRTSIDATNYVDFIVGGGYDWNRFEPDADDLGLKITTRSPFAKAGLGYNHKFSDSTFRAELGARRTINADAHVKVSGATSDSFDLKDRTSPYLEVGMLLNQHGQLPFYVGGYATYTEYKPDSDSPLADDVKLKRGEAGFKAGLSF
ncbi:outer membrane beta-barrel protein [Pseudomonas cerasi]|uniref:Outer membrane protein beta-barrel domain-containing protein n=1 Tax=Pseudomonas cerasi TaxID=1583341 RepID=A0A193SSE4_9PSED|nr:outer membrane beta-barrel protein [Pseudomonas cerasi]CZT30111.1 hypothetical protein PCPL58_3655 [Pseudomonas cerasi]SOS21830.1 hypothetical protein PL963_03743 [Pseudomonas cerasi]